MEKLYQALILGLVQGLTEFLPVSSSFHLRLVPSLLHWPETSLSFAAFLHLGTLVAIFAYFYQDVWFLFKEAFLPQFSWVQFKGSLAFKIMLGTIPAVLIGFGLRDLLEKLDSNLYLTSCCLIIVGLIILLADHSLVRKNGLGSLSLGEVILIGFGQAAALIPGVSRSGSTISVARFLGIDRYQAARFSFLLGMPVILGAGLWESIKMFRYAQQRPDLMVCAVGFLSAAISGYLVIGFFLKFLQNATLLSFVVYRLVIGLISLWLLYTGIIK